MKDIILTFFIAISCFSGYTQEDTEDVKVREYLEINGSKGQYEYAYDQLLQMMQQRYPETKENAQGWKYLKEHKTEAINEIMSLLTPIYESNFTRSEIDAMLQFYKGSTGRQLVADRSKLTEIQKRELNSFYNTEVGAKIIAKQPILTKEVGQVSEDWSHELYETAVSLLSNG